MSASLSIDWSKKKALKSSYFLLLLLLGNDVEKNPGPGDSIYKCDICGVTLSSEFALSRHRCTVHSGQCLFFCPQCDRRFNRKDNLQRHLRKPTECGPSTSSSFVTNRDHNWRTIKPKRIEKQEPKIKTEMTTAEEQKEKSAKMTYDAWSTVKPKTSGLKLESPEGTYGTPKKSSNEDKNDSSWKKSKDIASLKTETVEMKNPEINLDTYSRGYDPDEISIVFDKPSLLQSSRDVSKGNVKIKDRISMTTNNPDSALNSERDRSPCHTSGAMTSEKRKLSTDKTACFRDPRAGHFRSQRNFKRREITKPDIDDNQEPVSNATEDEVPFINYSKKIKLEDQRDLNNSELTDWPEHGPTGHNSADEKDTEAKVHSRSSEVKTCSEREFILKFVRQAFQGKAKTFQAVFEENIRDPLIALSYILEDVKEHVKDMMSTFRGVKLSLCLQVKFFKPLDLESRSDGYFWCNTKTLVNCEHLHEDIQSVFPKIISSVEEYCHEGSGWVILNITKVDLNLSAYQPLVGRCFTQLPGKLKNKKAILNIRNLDDKCFLWCVLAKLYPVKQNRNRVASYRCHEARLICDGIDFPVTISQIPKFEKLNNLSINLYCYENGLYPRHISEQAFPAERHIDLLLYDGHYFLITELDRLLSSLRPGHRKKFFCHRCLFPFYSEERLTIHRDNCVQGRPTLLLPPKEKFIQFKNIQRGIRQPTIVYADFECFTVPFQDDSPSNTNIYQVHKPCSYGLVKVVNCCGKPEYENSQIYRGKDPVRKFLKEIVRISDKHDALISNPHPMSLTQQQRLEFKSSTTCYICDQQLNDDRVRDHCHICGQYRGAAHNKCNQLLRLNRNLVVVFHNLRRYDSHLIMQQIGSLCKLFNFRLDCVAKTIEDYLGFTLTSTKNNWNDTGVADIISEQDEGTTRADENEDDSSRKTGCRRIRFIDSYLFLSSSLSQLVDTMADDDLVGLRKEFENISLLKRKGVFPYDAMINESFFNRSDFPSKSEFYSKLNKTVIDDDDYRHALNVWSTIEHPTMGKYHDLYLRTDVILLADVMERFRKLCMMNYQLDPVHYLTLPSFALDACLKITSVNLETIFDPDMYSMFEKGVRGGVTVVSHRHARANNPLVPGYDKTKPNSYIIYLDMNNLYGSVMIGNLPEKNFKWLTEKELKSIDFLSVPEDSNEGYILEVDLKYDKDLHDKHNDFPLAPERLRVDEAALSNFTKKLKKELDAFSGCVKLISNLRNKTKYVLHYRNLQLYAELGMEVGAIHRGIKFQQSCWLRRYIEINTDLRAKSKTKFDKDLFKLLNNSVFGKLMEDTRAYKEVKLVTNEQQLNKIINSPRFKRFSIFNDDLMGVALFKKSTCLDKPLYAGFSILDLSKHLMFSFHYKNIVSRYKKDARLLYADTDSYIYHIQTPCIYTDMMNNLHDYDTSAYPPDSPLFSLKNCKKLGKMKDETNGKPIIEFVGLRAKMYAYTVADREEKRAKGVKKIVVQDEIAFDDYKDALFSKKVFYHRMNLIRSSEHNVHSVTFKKKSLSSFDDKRFVLDDGVSTFAYGHYKIPAYLAKSVQHDSEVN